ncbi:MAG: ACP S-malonyltransferase [bacterium]
MIVAFLFPGQGMEEPRMGLALAERRPAARALLERASAAAGVDVERLLYRGGTALERTEVLQPALTAVSLGVWEALRDGGCRPDFVAGHSLGEVAAWAAAGGVSAGQAVELAAARGALMAQESARRPGRMLAVFGAEPVLQEALAHARGLGAVALAAHNGPQEWVLSGAGEALESVNARYASRFLPVSGAWHGPSMAGAVEPLRSALEAAARPAEASRFVSNRDGTVAGPEAIPALLAEQLVRTVQWAAVLRALVEYGATDLVTVGPGRVLRGLVRKNLGDRLRVHTTEDRDELKKTIELVVTGRGKGDEEEAA